MSANADALLTLGPALRVAKSFPIDVGLIESCVDADSEADVLFERARLEGVTSIDRAQRPRLARVTGEVAEAVTELLLDQQGYRLFWQITTPGIRGVDLLFVTPDESVLALEVKGTLRPNAIPRLTPSRLRQMSRDWLNDPANPGMADWSLQANDLYTAVLVVDLAQARFRIALSGDFERYTAVTELEQLSSLRWLEPS